MSGNYFILHTGTSNPTFLLFSDVNLTFTNNTIASHNSGTGAAALVIAESLQYFSNFSGNTIDSCAGLGMSVGSATTNPVVDTLKIWRCGGIGLSLSLSGGYANEATFSNSDFFGNTTANATIAVATPYVAFKNCTFSSETTYTTTSNILLSNLATLANLYLTNCSFSDKLAATNDINISNTITTFIHSFNTTYAGTNQLTGQTSMTPPSFLRSQKHDGSLNTTKTFMKYGTVTADQTTRHTASGHSWKMTPNNASNKLRFPGPTEFDTHKAAVGASAAVTITCYVYEDATYNGNRARLVIVGGIIGGIASDVTDTATAASDEAWEQLSVTATPNEAGEVLAATW